MNFKQFISVLRARKFIFVLTWVLTIAVAVTLSLILPKQYKADTTLIVHTQGADPVTNFNLANNMLPEYMATQLGIITSEKVALKVVDKLKLNTVSEFEDKFLEQNNGLGDFRIWLADMLIEDLDVKLGNVGSIVTIEFTSGSPLFASVVANAFADAYIDTNIELRVEPAQKAAEWFKDQVAELKRNVEEAQKKLTEYEQAKGILYSGDSKFDVETGRLNQLTTAELQSEEKLFDLKAKIRAVKLGQLQEADDELLDDAVFNNIKVQLSQAEAKFAEVKETLSENHPDYKSAEAELSSLRYRLRKELRRLQGKLEESAKREEKRVSQLKSKVAAQKQKLLMLNADLDQREALARDVDVAKQVLSVTMERMSQTSLEGQANLADVAVLKKAIPPVRHSKPNLLVNTFISVFIGFMLAIGVSMFFEFLHRKVRSKLDLEGALDLPVLTEIDKIKYR